MTDTSEASVLLTNGPGRQVLQALFDIGATFTKSLKLQPVLERIITSSMELAHGDSGSVMLVSESGDELVVTAAIGPRASLILGTRQPVDASIAGRAIQEGGPLMVSGRAERRGSLSSRYPQDINRSLVMPLYVTGRLVGVLNINCQSDPEHLTPEVVNLLQILSHQAAILIENARLYEELARKERRLETFVDKFLRMQAEQKRTMGLSETKLEAMLSTIMRRTIQEFASEIRHMPEEPPAVMDKLTGREREVLSFIVEGLTNKEIARRLKISTDTVKNHVVHIITKLGATDRTQAAVIAIRSGLLK